ncbi:hypothetical protein RZN05_12200 [Sphingomonas sp. HF-S4]|uniref:Uncharacterized protein n=1 Tax=Sphingomonas agrestis TaxID=3080540 RepID=A0ABU3Y9A6_9SPHN|nr:hypothetical protein [Sphingomonas sp. HF-S4]MDV3457748.1 hypothetical protein [Sphingomonas sp. HF-S4]
MAERKTKPTQISAEAFVDAVPDPVRRADAQALAALMARVSGEPAAMWDPRSSASAAITIATTAAMQARCAGWD